MNTVRHFSSQEIIEISSIDLNELKQMAKNAPLRRARFCLHHTLDDPVQEMIIALHRSTYVRPHCHHKKSESFHIIHGTLDVVFFDDTGRVTKILTMGPVGSGLPFVYRLSSPFWHMVIPKNEFVIFHETTTGPFVKEECQFPEWGPEDGDKASVAAFMTRINRKIKAF